MKWYIRQTARPIYYLQVHIDSGGMSVHWVIPQEATPFATKAQAESMVSRLVKRYPSEKVYVSQE